jgi:hypothetical protein
MQDTDKVDHGILIRRQAAQGRIVVYVTLDDIDRWQHDQVPCPRTPPRRYGYPQTAGGQPRNNMTPDKSGAANDENVRMLHAANSIRAGSVIKAALSCPPVSERSFPDGL